MTWNQGYEEIVGCGDDEETCEIARAILAKDESIEGKILRDKKLNVYPFAIDWKKNTIEQDLMTVGVLSFLISKNYDSLFSLLTEKEKTPVVKVKEWIANHDEEMREVVQDMSGIIEYAISSRREQRREVERQSEDPYRGHSHWSMPGM
ncbi:hypothetical protein KAT51_08105 [bacterium]|nr:hypothetical protein [bacterium]